MRERSAVVKELSNY